MVTPATWYEKEEWSRDCASSVITALRLAVEESPFRRQLLDDNEALYRDLPPGRGRTKRQQTTAKRRDRISINVVRSCCDALANQIAQARPRPVFVPTSGDYRSQKRCEKKTRFCEAAFAHHNVDRAMSRALLDCLVYDVGFIKVVEDAGRPCVDRVHPRHMWWSEAEAESGDPRNIYEIAFIDKGVAKGMYADGDASVESMIDGCSPATSFFLSSGDSTQSRIAIVDAYHLPSSPDSDDGRHVVVCESGVLLDEPWTAEGFPYVSIRFSEGLTGFSGESLTTQAAATQIEINRVLRDVVKTQWLAGNLKVYVPRGANVTESKFGNKIAQMIEFSGPTPPVFAPGQSISKESLDLIQSLIGWVYQIAGISQMQAAALKPSGIDSGAAIRAYSDETSARFILLARQYEEAAVKIGQLLVGVLRRISEDDDTYEVPHITRNRAERYRVKDVLMDEDEYSITTYAASAMPKTIAGRIAAVKDMVDCGAVTDPREIRRLVGSQDIDQADDETTAPIDLIEKLCDDILERGKYHAPEAFYDLVACVRIGSIRYMQAQLHGDVSEERRELLRQFVIEAKDLLSPPAPPPQPQVTQAQPGQPPSAPVPQPQAPAEAPQALPVAA